MRFRGSSLFGVCGAVGLCVRDGRLSLGWGLSVAVVLALVVVKVVVTAHWHAQSPRFDAAPRTPCHFV